MSFILKLNWVSEDCPHGLTVRDKELLGKIVVGAATSTHEAFEVDGHPFKGFRRLSRGAIISILEKKRDISIGMNKINSQLSEVCVGHFREFLNL